MARGRLAALVALLHPLPVAMTVAAAGAFAWIAADGAPSAERLGLFLGSVLLTQCAISVHNDYCDRGLDAVAKPWRAIPSGALSAASARRIAAALLGAGMALAAALGGAVFWLAALGTGAGLVYSGWLKRTALSWLPFVVGFPTLVLWAYAAVARVEQRLITAYLVGAPLVLAVHLADTLPDLAEDHASGVRGLGHRLGRRGALALCWVSLLVGGLVVAALGGATTLAFLAASGIALLAAIAAWRRDAAGWHRTAVALGAALTALGWLAALAG